MEKVLWIGSGNSYGGLERHPGRCRPRGPSRRARRVSATVNLYRATWHSLPHFVTRDSRVFDLSAILNKSKKAQWLVCFFFLSFLPLLCFVFSVSILSVVLLFVCCFSCFIIVIILFCFFFFKYNNIVYFFDFRTCLPRNQSYGGSVKSKQSAGGRAMAYKF